MSCIGLTCKSYPIALAQPYGFSMIYNFVGYALVGLPKKWGPEPAMPANKSQQPLMTRSK